MDLIEWLGAEKGRGVAMAAHFKRTPAAVSQWKTNGVPVDLMKAVRDFTGDRKSTRLNSSHTVISYAVFCLKKKKRETLRLPIAPRNCCRRRERSNVRAVTVDITSILLDVTAEARCLRSQSSPLRLLLALAC